jgi:hypothetical protein
MYVENEIPHVGLCARVGDRPEECEAAVLAVHCVPTGEKGNVPAGAAVTRYRLNR